jgi:DNA repair protein RecO (recombination protein O)
MGVVPTYRDQAVVLRTHKLGEADRIVTLLTRENGKVRAVARGVRRTSSKFGARLAPFSHVDVQLARGRSLDVVAQAVSLRLFGDELSSDYALYTRGEVMLETADALVAEEGSPARHQYRLLVGALTALADGTADGPRPAGMVLDSYLIRALAVAGYAPALAACARCGEPGPHPWFSPAAGGLVCNLHRPPQAARPSPEALELLDNLLAGDWPATRGVAQPIQGETSGLVAAYANWHLERSLRSLPLVDR